MGWGTVMLQLLFISVLETALTEVQEYSNIQLQMPRNHVLIIAQVIKKFRGNPALLCRRNLRKPNLGMANKTDWILRPAARDDAPSIFWLIQVNYGRYHVRKKKDLKKICSNYYENCMSIISSTWVRTGNTTGGKERPTSHHT